jgi:S-adenosylhomocysteine hydrolase
VDDAIARRRLELLGMKLEEPTADQLAYARSWK